MRVAVSKDGETFCEPKKIPTPHNFEEGVRAFGELAHELAGGAKIEAAAGGIAGPLDKNRTMLVNSPNISDWIQKPLTESLAHSINAPVFVENDNAIVGLGEVTAGAAKGCDIVAYVGVGTGVGGTRYVDGRIDRSAFGFEIGHQIIDADGSLTHTPDGDTRCLGCGQVGHLEGYVSGRSFENRYGKKAYDIDDPAVWEQAAKLLSYGLYNTMVHWSPDVICLGGSMIMGNPVIPMDRIEYYLRTITKIFPTLPKLKKAELGDVGGLYGALAFLKQKMGE